MATKSVLIDNDETDCESLAYARFFDITILYGENDEVFTPEQTLSVNIDLKENDLNSDDVTISALHFNEENKEPEVVPVEVEQDTQTITLQADSFSVYGVVYYYTVDFFYNNNEYHMSGGSEMLLSELFNKLNITKSVEDVVEVNFSNEELVKLTKQDNDYLITSLQAFTSHELLTITFNDGEVININVEDEIASGTFGNNLKWSIDDEGHFVLEPASGSNGIITTQYSSASEKGGTTPRTNNRQLWPWEAYKDKIITAEIKGEVRTYGGDNNYQLQGMFDWCENMISVDVSGLNVSRVGDVSFFFANCSKLKTITGLDTWTQSVSQADNVQYGVSNIRSIASMFRNCTSLEEVDLSSWTNNGKMNNLQNMCSGCTSLKKFTLNNPDFITHPSSQWHTGSNGPFQNCNALETVDMSNITVSTNANGLKELFTGLSSLKEVKMDNIDFSKVTTLENMFNNCSSLETLIFSPKEGAAIATNANMDKFFANCSKLKTLDLSNLNNSMASFHELGFEDLDSLETLIADNSKIWIDKNGAAYSSMDNVVINRDIDFIEDVDFEYTPNPADPNYSGTTPLEIDSTDVIELVALGNSKESSFGYTNTNSKGLLSPGKYVRTSPVDTADMEVPLTYYIIDGMDANFPTIEFLINGEWKKWDNTYVGDQSYNYGEMGDYYVYTYVTSHGHDTRVFTKAKTNEEWNAGTNTETDSYAYEGGPIRITYPKSATSINGTKHDVVITINNITFENMSRIPNTTDSTYTNYDADFNQEDIENPWGPDSNRTDRNKIPGWPYPNQYEGNTNTRRYLLNASVGELRFWNQVTKENTTYGAADPDAFGVNKSFLYSKGSGTYIDFDLKISDAEDGQSVLYWCDDLDMPENESWTMHETNPDADVRNAVNYAPGAEGIALGRGNDLSSITLANRTYLKLYNYADGTIKNNKETDGDILGNNDINTRNVANYIIGSRPDPETKKTRFYVKSNAAGSNYIWTTGTSCETTVLKSTSFKRFDILDTHLSVSAQKQINGDEVPTALDRSFDFVLEPVKKADIPSVQVAGIQDGQEVIWNVPNSAEIAYPDKVDAKNIGNSDSNISFGKMTFNAPGANYIDTGTYDPIYRSFKVYIDSNNQKFFYDNNRVCYTWTEKVNTIQEPERDEYGNILLDENNQPIMVDVEEIEYTSVPNFKPSNDLIKAYVFKISEKEGADIFITKWDKTEYYLKVVVSAPATDEEMEKGSKIDVTIGTKEEGKTNIAWGETTTKYGKDTKDNPYAVKVGTFNNKADEVELPAGTINVQKKLEGRNWRAGDSFHFILTTEDPRAPMPEGSRVLGNDSRFADIIIDPNNDTKVDDSTYKDKDGFNAITFTGAHLVDENGAPVNQKTFRYYIREVVSSESGEERITGITYSTERYAVDVTIKKVDDKLELTKKILKVIGTTDGSEVDIPSFTNTYKANETTYKMTADKDFKSYDSSVTLKDGDYEFVLKPIGTYAKVAPMPNNTDGTGDNRTLTVKNKGKGIKFEDVTDQYDGLDFLYNDEGDKKGLTTILLPYFDNNTTDLYKALHSEKGIDFEYEIYEVIPDGAVNNNDGTWTLDDETNHATRIYDGIHHTRKITVKVVVDEESQEEELRVEAHADDHKDEFYIDSDGNEKSVDTISNYDKSAHHTARDGAPLFRNQYIPYYGSLEVNEYWKDYNNKQNKRGSLSFKLYKQIGNEDPAPVTKDVFGKNINDLVIDTNKDGSVKWDNLPLYEKGKLIKYSIVEDGADDYYKYYVEDNITLSKDETSKLNIYNLLLPEEITKEVSRTIHYVTNKGKTVYEDVTSKASFRAIPRFKIGDNDKPMIDSNGNPTIEWLDEEGTLLGSDIGDGSGINWNRSTMRKRLSAVNTKDKDHYSYDIPTIVEIMVGPNDQDIEETVIYIPETYKVHFDPNDGEGDMPAQELTWDELEKLNPNSFKKSGYSFAGWNTKKDGSGTKFDNMADVINFLNENGGEITLYAQWAKLQPYIPPKTGIH